MKKIFIVIGTRPEVIKMAPIIQALQASIWAHPFVVVTGQQRELLEQTMQIFKLSADANLDLMTTNQTLAALTARLSAALDNLLEREKPDVVLAQGDTTSVFVAALTAFYRKIPFGHVEAGLRTKNIHNPFPEELNRVLVSRMTTWHFTPTENTKRNLLDELIPEKDIYVTGNTVIDALLSVKNITNFNRANYNLTNKKLLLLTAHRRESFGGPLVEICEAVLELCELRKDIQFLIPVHPNPNVQSVLFDKLGSKKEITLTQPFNYLEFIGAMNAADLILTDSGGVQEEAPALGKPVLVLRENTERLEAVSAGVVKLVGTNRQKIVSSVCNILENPAEYNKMTLGGSPYGDGYAASRISEILRVYFSS